MTLTCRSCPQTWSWSDEFSPFLIRDAHTCPSCGHVSRRPRIVWGLYSGLAGWAISRLDGWQLPLTLMLVLIPSLAIMQSLPGKNGPGRP
jgi:hypothetical protein